MLEGSDEGGGSDEGSESEEKDEAPKEEEPDGSAPSEEDVPSGEESAEEEAPSAGSGSDAAEADEPAEDKVPDPSDAASGGTGGTRFMPGPGCGGWLGSSGSTWRTSRARGGRGASSSEDVNAAKEQPARAGADAPAGIPGLDLAPWPKVDFEKYGEIERVALSRVKKISGPVLARNWVMIPHVTHNDEADITDLEAFRKEVNSEQSDVKVTMVALLMKACVGALRQFPEFNSSLDGDELVIKRYYNIGFAADTPQGLLVPVIKEADRKGLLDIAGELTELSGKAREGKISAEEMRGSTFTISSLGGIGGTSFTPIINAPEVAILGVTRSKMQPVWDKEAGEFKPRLMVPLSLSYDHRVIDGAAAARFTAHLATELKDIRRALL